MQDIQNLSRRLEDLQIDSNQKLWAQYTTGFDFGVDEAQNKIRAVYRENQSFQMICRGLELDLAPADRRRLEVLHRDFQPYHRSQRANSLKDRIDALETKLADILNKHRSVVDGRELTSSEIGRILSENSDRELRKRAYLSRAQVNRKLIDGGFLDLINLRKEFASACGALDFVSFSLKQDDLAPGLFDGWRDECVNRRQSYRKVLNTLAQQYLKVESYWPWDQSYLRSQICPRNREIVNLTDFRTISASVFRAYGFKIDDLPITYDLFPRKNKSEWGYMFPIQIGKDTRVLANMDNRFSSYWVLLHETAHAVHFLGLDPEDRLLNRGISGIVAEGFANFFGDLSYSKEFLSLFFNGDIENAIQDFSRLKCVLDLGNIASLSETLFDQELYRQDLKNLDDIHELKWMTERDLLASESYGEEPPWGHVIHHTTAPIYLHNYFLGDVMCESMKKAFFRKTGSSWRERPQDFGLMWRDEVLAPSGLYPFAELFERVTGQKANISEYLHTIIKNAEVAFI